MRGSLTMLLLAAAFPATAAAQASVSAALPPETAAAPTLAEPPPAATAPGPAEPPPSPASGPAEPPPSPALGPAEPPPSPAPPASPAAAPSPVPSIAVAFGWDALVDTYYLWNFTGDPNTQAPALRAFDTTANNFALNYAKLGLHAETEVAAIRLDVGAGHTAAIFNNGSRAASAPGTATTPSDTDALYGHGFLVQQAFATVKLVSFLSIDAGRFMTSACAEQPEANKNWLYSRSLLFYGLPGLYTGLRINLTPSPRLTLSLQVVNGANSDPDIDAHKTFGASATWADTDRGLLAAATTYVGRETAADGNNTGLLVDAFLIKETGRLAVGANADYVRRGDAYWLGVAGMGRFIVNDLFNLAARAEYLRTKNGGFLPQDASLYEVTVQGAFTMGKHYELRAELRADLSDQQLFARGTTPRKNQVTGLLAALAYF